MANKNGSKDKYSCNHESLIKIDLEHIALDELHLLLRVMDALLNNIIQEVVGWEKRINFNKKSVREIIHVSQNYNQILGHEGSVLIFGSREMKMEKDPGNMVSPVFLGQIRRNF